MAGLRMPDSRGTSLGWTPAAVAGMSRVGPEDVAAARALARRVIGKRMARLLDAGRIRR